MNSLSSVVTSVTDRIYLSGVRPLVERPECPGTLGITHILSCLSCPKMREVHSRVLEKCPGIITMSIPYRDNLEQSLTASDSVVLGGSGRTDAEMTRLAQSVLKEDNLATGVAFVRHALSEGGSILIHCAAGQSRSVSVLARYLSLEYGMSLDSAISMIRAARPSANPNPSFWRQLRELDQWSDPWDMYPSGEDLRALDLDGLML